MNSFLVRRLTPLFIFTVIIEALELLVVAAFKHKELDLDFLIMVKTAGVLLLTTMVSFLYVMLPYVLYLTILPQKWQNSRFDKSLTIIAYFIFVLLTSFEEVVSVIVWLAKNTSLDFAQEDLTAYLHSIYEDVSSCCNVGLVVGATVLFSIVYTLLTRKFLFTRLAAPKFGRRFFHLILYIAVCSLAYMNIDIEKLEINANNFNNKVAEEGTYNLIKVIDKKEIAPSIEKLKNKLEKTDDQKNM